MLWKDIANLRIKRINNYTKSQRHPWMTINFVEQENESVGELSKVCSHIVLKCLYLARFGRADIFLVCEQTSSCGHKVDESL